jgi:hypothetical protein
MGELQVVDQIYAWLESVTKLLGALHEKILVSGGIAVAILLATILFCKRMFSLTSKRNQSSSKVGVNIHPGPVKSIWDFNRTNRASSTAKSKDESSGKPFGSAYYYAHNNPSAKGGYKDGLRMEDFTMNQPRLLSRDGKPAEDEIDQSPPLETTQEQPMQKPKNSKMTTVPDVKLITKYQWDDPGDLNGIAHIRIDTLPGKGSTDVQWQDIKVKDISAKLIGDGLEVKVLAESGETYLLKVPTLYGQAAAIRAYVKPKRLVVRVWKVRSMLTVLDYGTSNLKPWPQLRKQ